MLLFIMFAAWFSGATFSLTQYPTFVFAVLLSFFGGVDIAMPFMLDLMRIPADCSGADFRLPIPSGSGSRARGCAGAFELTARVLKV